MNLDHHRSTMNKLNPHQVMPVHRNMFVIWAISKAPDSQKGHPQIWEGPIAYHTLAQKWYMANLGVWFAGKFNDFLDSRAEGVLPFWSGIFAAGLWAIWRGATGRGALQISFSPLARWGPLDLNPAPRWVASFLGMDSQLTGQPPLHSHSLASIYPSKS